MTAKPIHIHGGYIFDLLEDGDFRAYEYEVTAGNSVTFTGEWITYEDGEKRARPATLHVVFENDVEEMTEKELLSAGWDEYQIIEEK